MKGREQAEGTRLSLRVTPRASRDEVVGWRDGALRVRVTAPPVDGEANQAVLALLARALRVPRSTMAVVSGASGRTKVVLVSGLGMDAIESRLAAGASG